MSGVSAAEPRSSNRSKQVVVLTGLSGAGRSVAAGTFEDLGWFVIDNLPVSLVPKIAELAGSTERYERVALVMHGYDEAMASQVDALRSELEDRGSIFQSSVDTEVLVHLIAGSQAASRDDAIAGRDSTENLDGSGAAHSEVYFHPIRGVLLADAKYVCHQTVSI